MTNYEISLKKEISTGWTILSIPEMFKLLFWLMDAYRMCAYSNSAKYKFRLGVAFHDNTIKLTIYTMDKKHYPLTYDRKD